MAQEDNAETRGGRDVRHPFLLPAVCAILAAGAAMCAFSASGIFQVILIVLAVFLSAFAAMTYVAALLHSIMTGFRATERSGKASRRGSARRPRRSM